jgi:hypothetical protein
MSHVLTAIGREGTRHADLANHAPARRGPYPGLSLPWVIPTFQLSRIPSRKLLSSFDQKLQLIRDRVRGVVDPDSTGVYLVGRPGTSKTYTVRQELDLRTKDWLYRNARMSAMGLFDLLAEYPHHVIVLDDVPSLFADRQAIQILLPALDDEARKPRTVTYRTRRGRERILFYGGIIGVSNLPLKNDPLGQALSSRFKMVEHEPSDEEIVAFMRFLAAKRWQDLPPAEHQMVVEFLISESQELNQRLDLRHLAKARDDFRQWKHGKAKTDWRDLIRSSLLKPEVDPPTVLTKREEILQEIALVRELIEKYPGEPQRQFEASGLKKSTFYNRRRQVLADRPRQGLNPGPNPLGVARYPQSVTSRG